MYDTSEIKSLIERQGEAFDAFKASYEGKLEAERKEREGLEARMNNIGLGGGYSDSGRPTEDELAHKSAFLDFVRKGRDSELLEFEKKTMRVGSDPDGGYSVPSTIYGLIEKHLRDLSPMRQIARVLPIGAGTFKQIVNINGISSGWVGETSARPATNTSQMAQVSPPVGEVYAQPSVTQQLLDDSFFDVEGWLSGEIAEEFAVQEGAAFVTGDGINKPRGLITYDISTDADATRAFSSIQYLATGVAGAFPAANPVDKLISLVQSLRAPYRKNASWLMSSNTLFTIRRFKDGDGNYIWQPSLTAGTPSMLLGFPVFEDVNMPDPNTNSLSIAFGDFNRGYLILDRLGPRVLRDPFTNKPYVNFYTTKRVGGGLLNNQAIKLLKFGTS